MKKLLVGIFITVNVSLLLLLGLLIFGATYGQDSCTETEVVETKDINTPTPESLKDATIIVRQKDGTTKEMPANEFKVVPRKQQFITKTKATIDCSNQKAKNNRISLVGGYGPSGFISKSVKTNSARLEAEPGPHGGLQYQRLITSRFSIGAQVLSNKSASLLLGLDF